MRSGKHLSHALRKFLKREHAASPMEYALIGSIVLVVSLLLLLALGKDF